MVPAQSKLSRVCIEHTRKSCMIITPLSPIPYNAIINTKPRLEFFKQCDSAQTLKTTPAPTINAAMPVAAVFIGAAAPVYAIGLTPGPPFVPL